MRDSEAHLDAEPARERIAEILRLAMGAPEEEALEDETRRLMLQLSIEPLDNARPELTPAVPPRQTRRPLLNRLLGKTAEAPRA
ncbi:hypothetical protein PIB19_03040 [Sphingomonas sp. 7/4-4]|uniref:hypothetical protein n=1 Tax=Sphingomonas sp. 7/4-4 TaxID=3018446 RepID=UPI0022F3C142|nr:hypothetical protein [Sphingomonas sp. 7/4-4]WBY08491.1 hypothetical protein PIB19_03040 [Sphingomonas sp. 7/4-4]